MRSRRQSGGGVAGGGASVSRLRLMFSGRQIESIEFGPSF
ncbi:unnamed protein product [Leptidea sinapis]|uniref:Uncharacterized protein n=1 Tax=Leptidea sinapis TaxID=189913 RepID=A0A5E4Q566_9NEOP|nr:unnamed protein product [Leptidea sinapis]